MYQVAFMLLGMEDEMFRAMPVDFATTWPTTLNRILNNIPTIWKRKHVWIYGPHVYETDFTTSDVFGIKSVASPTTTPEAIDVVVATSAS